LKKWNECAAPEPPAYSTDTTSPMYRDAEVVRETRVHMTPANRATAFYWADNAGESGTPVGHWISIASQMVGERHLSGDDAARLVMMTALAQADAFIAAWGYKFQYSLLRPRTFIRRMIDSTWEPLIPTPPFPEYPSAHSTQSAAAATVLGAVIGDHVAFEDSTGLSIGNGVRRFESFRAAASEAGISRIYGGIHFPYGNTGGRALGDCVGEKVVERLKAVSLR
jgi:membrane-associated phospholipid phosphatase